MVSYLGVVRTVMMADTQQFNRAINNASREFAAVALKMKRDSQSLVGIGGALNMAITLPAIFASRAILRTGADYEAVMMKIRHVTKITGDEFRRFTKDQLELSKQTKTSPTELAKAAYIGAQARIISPKGNLAFQRAIAMVQAQLPGDTSAEKVADAFTTTINAFNRTAKDFEVTMAQMRKTIDLGKISWDTYAGTIGQVAKVAAQIPGKDMFRDMNLAVALMTQSGVPAGTAATALRNIYTRIYTESKKEKSSLNVLAREQGFPNIVTMYQDKFGGNLIEFLQELGRIQGVSAEAAIELNFLKREMSGVLALMSVSKNTVAEYNKAYDSALTDFKAYYNEALNSPLMVMQNVSTAYARLKLSFFTAIGPQLIKVVDWFSTILDKFANMPAANKQLAALAVVSGVMGSIGVALAGVLKSITFFLTFSKLMRQIGNTKGVADLISTAVRKEQLARLKEAATEAVQTQKLAKATIGKTADAAKAQANMDVALQKSRGAAIKTQMAMEAAFNKSRDAAIKSQAAQTLSNIKIQTASEASIMKNAAVKATTDAKIAKAQVAMATAMAKTAGATAVTAHAANLAAQAAAAASTVVVNFIAASRVATSRMLSMGPYIPPVSSHDMVVNELGRSAALRRANPLLLTGGKKGANWRARGAGGRFLTMQMVGTGGVGPDGLRPWDGTTGFTRKPSLPLSRQLQAGFTRAPSGATYPLAARGGYYMEGAQVSDPYTGTMLPVPRGRMLPAAPPPPNTPSASVKAAKPPSEIMLGLAHYAKITAIIYAVIAGIQAMAEALSVTFLPALNNMGFSFKSIGEVLTSIHTFIVRSLAVGIATVLGLFENLIGAIIGIGMYIVNTFKWIFTTITNNIKDTVYEIRRSWIGRKLGWGLTTEEQLERGREEKQKREAQRLASKLGFAQSKDVLKNNLKGLFGGEESAVKKNMEALAEKWWGFEPYIPYTAQTPQAAEEVSAKAPAAPLPDLFDVIRSISPGYFEAGTVAGYEAIQKSDNMLYSLLEKIRTQVLDELKKIESNTATSAEANETALLREANPSLVIAY